MTSLVRGKMLRRILEQSQLSFLMEAHNAVSAKIAQEAGFEGIWASGLTISTSLGLRDANEASWSQIVEIVEHMADATDIPILVDGDTGYGDFNNLRRLVRKLEDRGIAGVCIEDKLFPKTNSFVGEAQPLAPIGEFCGAIRAVKDCQRCAEFVLVARVEALVSGRSMSEALERAEAYRDAGADAILIHSKKPSVTEILNFSELWKGGCPLIIVPTTYHTTPTETFRQMGISTVIWANHLMRASVNAMQQTARLVWETESLSSIEGRIATLDEIFRLVDTEELENAKKIYATFL